MKRDPGTGAPLEVAADLRFRKGSASFLQDVRVRLLEKIDELGSIARAARSVGMSYKTAWEAVEALNRLASRPLVRRAAGGRGGGGTVLTDEGRSIVRTYRAVEREHAVFLRRIGERIAGAGGDEAGVPGTAMRVSARNVFRGTVEGLARGAVGAEVTVSLQGGGSLRAVITNESAAALGLSPGKEVFALFKASAAVLGRDLHATRGKAGNVLCGTVEKVVGGPANREVLVALPGGGVLTAVAAGEGARGLRFARGDHACALVEASSVMLGVPG